MDWARAERSVDTALPADYKRLVEAYGDGVFDETVWLLVPGSAYTKCDLRAQATERYGVLEGLREVGARILPWGCEEGSGAFLYWLVRPGQHPDEWTVLYNEGQGPLREHHDVGCLDFLSAVLTGTANTVCSATSTKC
ncbi:hypothetical protein [Streptomyces finlayi]|uniref:hypothetical protein n=1 Tax=Streptomyces finlayi TaxID=67296 RepID=UPI0016247131|nr:hypothetical protein [Streptomyces finlayi]